MGHDFCRSHWRVKINDKWDRWRDPPCFADVRLFKTTAECIQAKVVPTVNDQFHPNNLTFPKVNKFIEDVMEVMPDVTKRVDDYTFEYPLKATESNYWKFLGCATLIRAVEEWWHWVDNYFEMRQTGIPRDVALLTMGLGGTEHYPVAHCGHAICGSLASLKSLKHFNFVDALLKPCDRLKGGEAVSLWSMIQQPQWFGSMYRYPHFFKLTPKIYNLFLRDDISEMDKQLLVNTKVYNSIEVS